VGRLLPEGLWLSYGPGRTSMPFRFGQVYECTEDARNRQAIVLRTRSEGQEGLLRYVDTRGEEWVTWDEFQHAAKWRRGER
jgi:hypothetical protein